MDATVAAFVWGCVGAASYRFFQWRDERQKAREEEDRVDRLQAVIKRQDSEHIKILWPDGTDTFISRQ
jgi:hypothetical protein